MPPPSDPTNRASELPSFDALYERYGARVLNLLHRMTGNEDVSRDLAQDVWLQVYRHLDRFQARADVFTWIYRIAVNRALNHLKREKRNRWVRILDETVGEALTDAESAAAAAAEAASSSPPLDRAVENQELSDHLWNAIQQLEPMYRVPLVLFHYEEQSYQQIADTMGLTLPAVQARIFRARKQLAKLLGPVLKQL